MLQPHELKLEDMGDLGEIIPGPEPVLIAQRNPIPQFGAPMRRPIIPVCEPWLSGNELKYITEAVETNWISSAGGFIHRFEAMFAEKMDARYGVACMNGTVALHLALATLGHGARRRGDHPDLHHDRHGERCHLPGREAGAGG